VDAPEPQRQTKARASRAATCIPERLRSTKILKSLGSIESVLATAESRTGSFVSSHPRSLTAAVTLALAGFGVTAFGIVERAPDAADLPTRLVTEIVTPSDLATQVDTLADHELLLYRSETTRASDTADSLLRRLGLADPALAAFLRNHAEARKLLEGRPGKRVQARAGRSGLAVELVARFATADASLVDSHFTRLSIVRGDGSFNVRTETVPLSVETRLGSGTVVSSLFAATDEAHLPDAVASQIAEVFGTDIDFHRDLRRGDTFSVMYQAPTADGEPVSWSAGSGRVLAAEFVNNGREHTAIWFPTDAGKGAYFDAEGKNKRRSFLASPLEFSRVTSGFAMRKHPIFKEWRQHKGVDYAAPTGTPARTVGDGVVSFAGRQNGYGNVVEVRHSNERVTVYAHLSRIDVRLGQRVEQGERVGGVGATGWATGPHLHFEFKVSGQHQDPMAIARSAETVVVAPQQQARFAQLALQASEQLSVAASAASGRYFE
jgi:murein DD-endopeptidase MepM/ murein hydrolase activator NlpD